MNRSALAIALLASALFVPRANAQPMARVDSISAVPAPVLLPIEGMFQSRYAKVGDDFFVAGQPTEKALREMKALGVTTVINLRSPEEMARIGYDEPKLVAELGMRYVYIPMRGTAALPYSPAGLETFTQAMRDAEGKVLLHCTIAWRASHLWGAYLIQQGLPADDVLRHTRAINLMDDHRMSDSGTQPIEEFLGRPVPGLGRP
ncbi:MAG: sulfur transferase domain-containing protein [Gemmatimonadaceae bacterium]